MQDRRPGSPRCNNLPRPARNAGPDGAFVLDLLRALHKPVVTTLHTVSRSLPPARQARLDEILARSARIVVLTEDSAAVCRDAWPRHASRVRVIEHGVPAVPWR